jgi:hypothetical protein
VGLFLKYYSKKVKIKKLGFDATRMSCLASIGCMMDGRTLSVCPFDVEMGLLDDLSPLQLEGE